MALVGGASFNPGISLYQAPNVNTQFTPPLSTPVARPLSGPQVRFSFNYCLALGDRKSQDI